MICMCVYIYIVFSFERGCGFKEWNVLNWYCYYWIWILKFCQLASPGCREPVLEWKYSTSYFNFQAQFLKRTHSSFLPYCLPSGKCNFLKESMCDFSLIPWDACRPAVKGTLYWGGCVFALSHRLRRFFFRRVLPRSPKRFPVAVFSNG